MKSISVAKYSINNIKRAIIIFYSVFIAAILILSLIDRGKYLSNNVNITMRGGEFSTVILIFVIGLCSFKENFYFTQNMNISRKSFLRGIILSMIPMAALCSMIDLILNRIFNLWLRIPNIYDMIYGGYSTTLYNFQVTNSIKVLFETFIFQFFFLMFVFTVGFFITNLYYKCNTLMKVVISFIPIILINVYSNLSFVNPNLISKINNFFNTAVGMKSNNVYMVIMNFTIGIIVLNIMTYLLMKKATVKCK